MNIDISVKGAQTLISLQGRLDTTTAPRLEKAIADCGEEMKELILDLKELVYISSAGLRVLLSAQKRMLAQGSMKVKNVSEDVMDVLEMTGFVDILEIE